ncbi:phospho-sugar mutase [Staphylococcus sp. 17KM0847]|uniref:phospho-sugar mutase n=1 Tax=Staphylococcus sp. 17KM0847 TaxID=2583989 RepID=UPI0015DCF47A|nr:phospho-sugar mutase [Staphylococcus sp. 17KM0847]QLK85695.1 phospho-sugar mutase [Staphylococcus sp. 17KM0847]
MYAEWLARLDESMVRDFYEVQTDEERKAGFDDTLSFGTAGIRSTFGLGPGRLNKFTIRKVALGLAHYLLTKSVTPTVVVHFDTRLLSASFAEEISKVLATEGIQVILPTTYKSTPELSFAVRYLNADAGVMITASHNPSHYNGVKVYGADGGQLLPEQSACLSDYINSINAPLAIEAHSLEILKKRKKILPLKPIVTNAYQNKVLSLVGKISDRGAKIVLTSLHGTSLPLATHLLTAAGFTNYVVEEEQSQPNGHFPTVKSANPEEQSAFDHGIVLAHRENASLIIATDPDADRFGIVERYEDGTTRYFNGNEIGLLLMKLRHDTMKSTKNHYYVVKTIVTSALSEVLARALNIETVNVLTGFKYISNILEQKSDQLDQLVLAYEESHGYLTFPLSRDKDAIQFIPLLVKYKQQLTAQGLTFRDVLNTIYEQFGSYHDLTLSPQYDGEAGRHKIEQVMTYFRQNTFKQLAGLTIKTKEDYWTREITDMKTGSLAQTTLPQADVIRYTFEEGFIALRPSGTEPKMKVYFSLNVDYFDDIVQRFQEAYLD